MSLPVTQCNPKDSEIYKRVRDVIIDAHCDYQGDKENHTCQGAVTFRAESITLRCPICGSCKALTKDGK